MSKRSNTTRSDGRIAVQVYIGRVDGKRRYKTVYGKTQKEANQKADEIRAKLRKGFDLTTNNNTFFYWCELFLRQKHTTVSNGQYNEYSSAAGYLKDHLGKSEIGKIQSADIQYIIDTLARKNPHTKRPSSRRTLKGILYTASQIFDLAINNRVIDYNPCRCIEIPKSAPKSYRRALTQEEQQWIVDTPHRGQCAAMVMMYAGLRRGELIPLTWSDIDFDRKTISVNKSVEQIGSNFIVKDSTKTPAGIRLVSIPQVLSDFLLEQYRSKKSMFVCPSVANTMMSPSAWSRMWESYISTLNIKYGDFSDFQLKAMGVKPGKRPGKCNPHQIPLVIPPITPHWLRHTFATLLYMAGVDVLTAKEQLGHADIKTTLSIYTHLDNIYKTKSMSKLDDYLSSTCKSDASQEIG